MTAGGNKMEINTTMNGSEYIVALSGELNTLTAPKLSETIDPYLEKITKLTLDFAQCDYVSSAGLRVLLSAQKTMNKQGSMVVRGANEDIMEIFDVTGFADILTIE